MLRQVAMELQTANPFHRVATETNVRLSVKDCKDFNTKGMTMLIGVEGEGRDVALALEELGKMPGVRHVYESFASPERALCLMVLDRPALCSASLSAGVVCLRCPFNSPGEQLGWEVMVRRSEDLKNLVTAVERQGTGVKITRVSEVNQDEYLTPRQREVLLAAISSGYFDFPRKVGLSELSARLGVKPSTLSEILRGAERHLMLSYGKKFSLKEVIVPPLQRS